jgi:hypothetical protein
LLALLLAISDRNAVVGPRIPDPLTRLCKALVQPHPSWSSAGRGEEASPERLR